MKTQTHHIPQKIHLQWVGGPIPQDSIVGLTTLGARTASGSPRAHFWTDDLRHVSVLDIHHRLAGDIAVHIPKNITFRQTSELDTHTPEQVILDHVSRSDSHPGRNRAIATVDMNKARILHQEGGLYVEFRGLLSTNNLLGYDIKHVWEWPPQRIKKHEKATIYLVASHSNIEVVHIFDRHGKQHSYTDLPEAVVTTVKKMAVKHKHWDIGNKQNWISEILTGLQFKDESRELRNFITPQIKALQVESDFFSPNDETYFTCNTAAARPKTASTAAMLTKLANRAILANRQRAVDIKGLANVIDYAAFRVSPINTLRFVLEPTPLKKTARRPFGDNAPGTMSQYQEERLQWPWSGHSYCFGKEAIFARTGYAFKDAQVRYDGVFKHYEDFLKVLFSNPYDLASIGAWCKIKPAESAQDDIDVMRSRQPLSIQSTNIRRRHPLWRPNFIMRVWKNIKGPKRTHYHDGKQTCQGAKRPKDQATPC